jgi:CBS domain containing-hemolysin-like protein
VEHEILDALFTLQDRPVREVMTPRVDIVTLTVPIDIAGVRAAVAETGHSRYPVTTGDLDHLLGVLYVKDLLQLPRDPTADEIRSLVRTPRFVPESAPIMRVLHDLRAGRSAFAVVLDEHGGVDGLVTVKDLVSELVGELQDEYDPGAPSVVAIAPREWLTDGRVPIEELSATIGIELPSGAYTTAGGLLMAAAGRIPDEGDIVVIEKAEFKVLQMDRNRVDRIRVVVP